MTGIRRALRTLAVYAFHTLFVRPVLWGFVGVRYRRRGLVPREPCLIVANHNSHLDAAVLMTLFPLRRLPHVHPVAAADYFGKTWLLRTMAMLFMNGIPIERNAKPGTDPLAPMVEALGRGETLVFFPEGSRGEAGVVAPFRSGIGRLVRAMPGLVIVPVYLTGPERIWPRGQAIPVPLGIDANVGKPRTYPVDREPRELADQVREDVLALAPPPPPVPGPRPARPLRVAVCAIEPSARGDLSRELAARLGRLGRTVGIGATVIEADESGIREATGGIPVARSRAWIGLLARALRIGGIFQGYRFAELVERARMDEALEDGRSARYVVGDGSALVDLMAWADAGLYRGSLDERGLHHLMLYLTGERRIPLGEWWGLVRKAPGVWLLNVLDLARLRVPDLIVLVLTRPEVAVERRRMAGGSQESHENEEFLGRIDEAYRRVSEVLRRHGADVAEVDGETLDPSLAADALCARLSNRVERSHD